MGIKNFYTWYKTRFTDCISSSTPDSFETLAIDMNGIFHSCAQDMFAYGFHNNRRLSKKMMHVLFSTICETIDSIRHQINPTETLVLSVDGVAGLGKIMQQRQRRFRTSMKQSTVGFDSNAFTPGTKLMDKLTKFIDFYIRNKMRDDQEWQRLRVVFSNEKAIGEGEHKIMKYIRRHNQPHKKTCIFGLDADLLLLGIMTPVHRIYIARRQLDKHVEFIDVDMFRQELINMLIWEDDDGIGTFQGIDAVHDFVLMTCLLGNDFLPAVPTLSINDGEFDNIIQLYKSHGRRHGHMTYTKNGEIRIRAAVFFLFVDQLANREVDVLYKRYKTCHSFFPNPIILKNMYPAEDNDDFRLDMVQIKHEYYVQNFENGVQINHIVDRYIYGISWVLNYYSKAIPNWEWFFPYLYAPFLSDFRASSRNSCNPLFQPNTPVPPLLQLLMVTPPRSSFLLPYCMRHVVHHDHDQLGAYFPRFIVIDLADKQKDWEGIVLLQPIDFHLFYETYNNVIGGLTEYEKKLNRHGKHFQYTFCQDGVADFRSCYGLIRQCPIVMRFIDF